MNARTLRRAQERKARKQALKAARQRNSHQDPCLPEPGSSVLPGLSQSDAETPCPPAELSSDIGGVPHTGLSALKPFSSDRRVAANQRNARLSTGPQTPEGKAKTSRNALKTGLTGRTILLPGDDTDAYQGHLDRFLKQFAPAGERESELVQSLADTRWRLNRIPSLESGIYALARTQFADLFPNHDPQIRAALIEAHTFITYQKQLNNLSVQEARLRRHFEKDLAELQSLQVARRRMEAVARPRTPETAVVAPLRLQNGLEFSPQNPDSPSCTVEQQKSTVEHSMAA